MSKAQAAIQAPAGRYFRIECLAAGAPYNWQGHAANEADAFGQAAEAMVQELPWVHAREVKQTACLELTRPELATWPTFGREVP